MQMKKRVLSAFMALCMVCSLVGAAWAVIPQVSAAVTGVTIENTIIEDGLLTANLQGTPESNDTITYTWYRSLTGLDNSWEEVQLQRVTGTEDNIVNDGQSINVAYDSIAADVSDNERYYYRVGVSVNGENEIYSQSVQVPYYIQLQNGSFEAPVIEYWNDQLENGAENLIWLTTGEGGTGHRDDDIEIVRPDPNKNTDENTGSWWNPDYKTFQEKVEEMYGPSEAAAGDQFAELNCEAYGALYQDVMTVPGADLYWSLYHRARITANTQNPQDRMALVIMPANEADTLTVQLEEASNSPSQIEQILDQYKNQGGYVKYITDETSSWNYHSGTYTVPEDQYLTRFFFVAVSTGSNSATVGNLLDDVKFSSTPAEPQQDQANITVTNVVEGYVPGNDYTVGINLSGNDVSAYNHVLTTFRQSDGTYQSSYTFTIDVTNQTKTINITETPSDVSGYDAVSVVQVDNGETTNGTSAQLTVRGGNSYNVTFTNTYTPSVPDDFGLTTGKTAIRDEDQNYDLTLSVTGDKQEVGGQPVPVDILFIVDRSGSMNYVLDEDSNASSQESSRMDLLRDAVGGLVDTVEANTAIDAHYSVVAFAGSKYYESGGWNGYTDYGTEVVQSWTDNAVQVKTSISENRLNVGGGTNYQQGIHTGKEQLDDARENATTYVIFVSDGEPTYRGIDVTNSSGDANRDSSDGNGNGQNDRHSYNINAAVEEIRNMTCDYFYAIGMGPEFGQEWQSGWVDKQGTTNLKSLANAVNATSKGDGNVYSANDTEGLEAAFNQIASSITSFTCQNVIMYDPLSVYADIVMPASGEISDLQFTVMVEKLQNGVYTEVAKETVSNNTAATFDENVTGTAFSITPSFDAVTKTITATFTDNYELEPGYRYSVSVKIKPSTKAITEGKNSSNAQNEPDEGTGTHADAGESGFWSNDNDNAYVTYQVVSTTTGGGTSTQPGKTPFPKPVIQVPDTGNLTITKDVEGVDSNRVADQTYYFTITADNATAEKVNGNTYGAAIFADGKATVTITGAESLTISGLPLGTYTVVENTTSLPDIDTDYDNDGDYYFSGVKYGDQEQATSTTATVTADATATVTITNTYAPYRTVTITKDVGGNMGDTTHPFTFTTSVNGTGITNGTVDVNGTLMTSDGREIKVSFTEGSDTAALTEKGYTLADGDTLTITKLKDGDVITLKETDGNDNGYQTVYTIENGEKITPDNDGNATHTVAGDADIIVTNKRNVGTPTGFFEDNLPFTLMISAAGLAGIALIATILVRRQRRRRE